MRCFAPGLLLLVFIAATAQGGEFAYCDTRYAELDPHRIRDAHDERLVLALFEGLTVLDPATGEVAPGAAERWAVDPDGRTWTFNLRKDAIWSDGKPVRAEDFIHAWRHALDPYEPSRWAASFRVIEGCADLADDTAAMDAVGMLRTRLKKLLSEDGTTKVPGGEMRALLARSGLARYVDRLEEAAVKALVEGGGTDLTRDAAEALQDALKKERRRLKKRAGRAFDAFGRKQGVEAPDERTLLVRTERPCPWLPALLARGWFAPRTERAIERGEQAFLPGELLANGPFVLKGRGAKPHPGVRNPLSVVHLVPNPRYAGPRKAQSDAVFCFTGQGAEEDLRRLEAGELQWLANPVAALGAKTEKLKGFEVHPSGAVVLLRFRCDRPPFDDITVRRAIADALQGAALGGRCWPRAPEADRLLPPTVAPEPAAAQPRRGGAAAKKALKAAGLNGEAFPWVELRYVDRGCEEELADRVVELLEKKAGIELGLRIESEDEMRASMRAGAYAVQLDRIQGLVADKEGYVLPFARTSADGGVGWDDPVFEALARGIRDPQGLLADRGEALALVEGLPGIGGLLDPAADGDPRALAALRGAFLDAAEARLLEAFVVVPLVFPRRAFVVNGASGIGSEAAWKNPGFVGALAPAR